VVRAVLAGSGSALVEAPSVSVEVEHPRECHVSPLLRLSGPLISVIGLLQALSALDVLVLLAAAEVLDGGVKLVEVRDELASRAVITSSEFIF